MHQCQLIGHLEWMWVMNEYNMPIDWFFIFLINSISLTLSAYSRLATRYYSTNFLRIFIYYFCIVQNNLLCVTLKFIKRLFNSLILLCVYLHLIYTQEKYWLFFITIDDRTNHTHSVLYWSVQMSLLINKSRSKYEEFFSFLYLSIFKIMLIEEQRNTLIDCINTIKQMLF
jgi:hypothetical protein